MSRALPRDLLDGLAALGLTLYLDESRQLRARGPGTLYAAAALLSVSNEPGLSSTLAEREPGLQCRGTASKSEAPGLLTNARSFATHTHARAREAWSPRLVLAVTPMSHFSDASRRRMF